MRIHPRLRHFLAALLAAAIVPAAHAQVSFPDRGIVAGAGTSKESEGQTWRPVVVDPRLLRTAPKSGLVWFPSTGRKPIPVRFLGMVDRGDGFATWTGKVRTTSGEQSVVLTLGKGQVFGIIPQADGPPLRLETRQGKTWLVEGESRFRAPAGDDFTLPPPSTAAEREQRAVQDTLKAQGDPRVDVLVLYAPGLVNVWGSIDAVHARIAQLEAITRQSYVDSGAAIDIRVVGRHLVDYTTKNTNGEALAEMQGDPTSPLHLEAARLRGQYGADLVVFMRDFERGLHDSCGNGYILGYHGGAFAAERGFSVVADHGYGGDNCSDWTFAHELGHNMGAHHDTETTEGDYGAYPYSRGHRATTGSNRGFATIMAYTTLDQWRLGLFSAPLLNQCLGQACGIAGSADNARGLSNAAAALSSLVFATSPGASPTVSISDVQVTEGATGTTIARFGISLSAVASGPVQLSVSTGNGSAVAGSDYVAVASAPVTIPAGQTRVEFDVTVNGDTVVEADEVFSLTLQSVSGAAIADGQGIATIVNDEAIPTISVADVARPEGNADTVLIPVTIRLSAPSATPVGFTLRAHEFAPAPTAAVVGEDFTNTQLGNLVIPAGMTSETIYIASRGDTAVEQDESLYVVVGNVTGALVGDTFAVVTLRDDDGPDTTSPRLSITDANALEGDPATFELKLSAPSESPVTVDLATAERAATPGSDFTPLVTTLTIPAGQTRTSVTVQTLPDGVAEPDENFWLFLSNANGAVIEDVRGVGWIRDDDLGPPVNPGNDFRARNDRVVVVNGDPNVPGIPVVANDAFEPARLAGGSLTITSRTNPGASVVQDPRATPGTPADDTIRYRPPLEFTGEERIGYRLCEGGTGARCTDAVLTVHVRPVLDHYIYAAKGGGFNDIVVPRLRDDTPAGTFSPVVTTTPLVAGQTVYGSLQADPTPATPWDAARSGTWFDMKTVPPSANGQPADWRLLADAHALPGDDLDLYVGVDSNLDNLPQETETRCVAAMSDMLERCEFALQHPGSGQLRYWVMVHNRGTGSTSATVVRFLVPMGESDGSLVATAPGLLDAQDTIPLRLAWTDPTLFEGESRAGYVRLSGRPSTDGLFPVRVDAVGNDMMPIPLVSGVAQTLELKWLTAQDRMFIDVPVGASALTVTTTSPGNISLYLAHVPVPSGSSIAPAPARQLAQASDTGPGGNKTLTISGAALLPGRWYVTPVNGLGNTSLEVKATVTGATLPTRPGSYFNASRSGHGLFLYPAADQWTGLWYTYLQDGTPTWYYLQGQQPGSNGLWTGTLYRSAWNGSSNRLTAIGRGQVAPTGTDTFTFTYTLDGETGSEPMAPLGRGCPTLAGLPLDVSSTWFNPARAGAGYSVQMFEDYEFHAAFIYDQRGIARFVLAESPGFAGTEATLALDQLRGFCPLCTRTGNPSRQSIGTLARRFSGGSFANIAVDGIFAGTVPGAWTADEAVQPLGGPGTTQGCQP